MGLMAGTNHATDDGYTRISGVDAFNDLIRRAREEEWTSLAVLGPRLGVFYAEHPRGSGFAPQRIVFVDANLDLRGLADICCLTCLRALCIPGHSLPAEGAKAIAASLTGLTMLDLSHNQIGTEGARAIAASLTALTSLNVWDNEIGDEGAEAIATSLTALTNLNLSGNQISNEGAKAIAASLTALTNLNLSGNQISNEGAKAIAASLTVLTNLNLSGNQIGDEGAKAIAASLATLTNVDLNDNQIGDEGANAIAMSLRDLSALWLSGNQIGDHGAAALGKAVSALELLQLSSNPRISARGVRALFEGIARRSDGGQHLRELGLEHCQDFSELFPQELVRGGDAQALLASFRRLSDSEPLNELRLLVVGNEAVGKTSLVRFLTRDQPCDPKEQKTPGIALDEKIEVAQWTPERCPVRLNVWDFGGQEIMHGTHNYFLTHRSLYLIVLEARREDSQNEALDTWLKVVKNRGGAAPVLVVVNKAEDSHPYHPDEARFRREYPNIVGFMRTTCHDDERSRASIQALRVAIVKELGDNHALRHVRDPVPTAWLEVKASLRALAKERKTVDFADYLRLCADPARRVDRHITEPAEQNGLLRLLNELGVVVAHGLDADAAVSPRVTLLDPNWLTQAIYTLLNSGRLSREHAVFEGKRLGEYLAALPTKADYQPRHFEFITDMMQHPDIALCFELPEQRGRFLVPAALPDTEPEGLWSEQECLRFRYTYDLLPASLMARLIVDAHSLLSRDKPTLWKTGVVLEVDGSKVLVRADRAKKLVDVLVFGAERQRRQALGVVREYLRRVHGLHHALGEQARVPLPDQPEVTVGYDHLLELEREEGPEYSWRPEGAKRKYTVAELLDGVRSDTDHPPAPRAEREAPPSPKPKPERRGVRTAVMVASIAALATLGSKVVPELLKPKCEEGKEVACDVTCASGFTPKKLCSNEEWGACKCQPVMATEAPPAPSDHEPSPR